MRIEQALGESREEAQRAAFIYVAARTQQRRAGRNGAPDADHSLGQVIKSLGELIDKKAEYSAFAKAVIEGFKKADRLWMDAVGMI